MWQRWHSVINSSFFTSLTNYNQFGLLLDGAIKTNHWAEFFLIFLLLNIWVEDGQSYWIFLCHVIFMLFCEWILEKYDRLCIFKGCKFLLFFCYLPSSSNPLDTIFVFYTRVLSMAPSSINFNTFWQMYILILYKISHLSTHGSPKKEKDWEREKNKVFSFISNDKSILIIHIFMIFINLVKISILKIKFTT